MSVPYSAFIGAFLAKVSDFDFAELCEDDRVFIVDGFMKRAVSAFRKNCKYDLSSTGDDELRVFSVEIPEEDLDEIADIVSEGMLVQWMKPFVYKQELLENVLNTKDFTTYSPAELLLRVRNAYKDAQRDFTNKIREYSYNHGDLGGLHL